MNRVYVYTDMLALFAPSKFEQLPNTSDPEDDGVQDLTAHLTNTCLQDEETAKESVYLLSDLVGKPFLSPETHVAAGTLSTAQTDSIISRIGGVVGETFKAGLGMPNHFSVSDYEYRWYEIQLTSVCMVVLSRLRPMHSRSSGSTSYYPRLTKDRMIFQSTFLKLTHVQISGKPATTDTMSSRSSSKAS